MRKKVESLVLQLAKDVDGILALTPVQQSLADSLVSLEDTLAFAEYFRANFNYYDCNANGRIYERIYLLKDGPDSYRDNGANIC